MEELVADFLAAELVLIFGEAEAELGRELTGEETEQLTHDVLASLGEDAPDTEAEAA